MASPSNKSKGMLINTISKMVVGLDKSQKIKTEVEEWLRKREETEPEGE
jgi:hypothetical protein